MKFQIGDVISVSETEYRVIGSIRYQNLNDRCEWDEYRIQEMDSSEIAWLSVDEIYNEYSLSKVAARPSTQGFHEVDRGVEVVVRCAGNVDVGYGDKATFIEYEDPSEEFIISEEIWEDEDEWSVGHYVEPGEIKFIRNDPTYRAKANSSTIGFVVAIMLFFLLPSLGGILENIHFTTSISKYLKKSTEDYSYVTSVTGNDKQKANVYQARSGLSIENVSKDIIRAIEGETEYVQQDSEEKEGAVAILTAKEYCIVYPSEDSGVLVQVSNRKFAYTTDHDLYRGSRSATRYYRRFYHSTGYGKDSTTYKRYDSPYSSYSDGDISYSGSDSYSTYSSSVRQSSISARQSSGGGLSGGK